MSKIQYVYFPLDGASIVLRKHPRDITPPGMVNIHNAIPARSDAPITIRPDWRYSTVPILGISSSVVLPETSELRDILNSASGIYGSSQVTYFTSYIPYGINNGVLEVLCDTHDSGTCNLVAGDSVVTGNGTEFLEKAYRGALVRFKNNGTSYSGSPYLWTDSPAVSGEWYVTDLLGAEVPLLGLYIRGLDLQYFLLGTVGSLSDYRAAVGDGDSLGFDTLYVNPALASEPSDRAAGSSRYITLQMGTNISGSNLKWTDSPAVPGEYYLTERDGTVPPFVPNDWVSGPTTPEYMRRTSDNQSWVRFWDRQERDLRGGANYSLGPSTTDLLTYGTLGSLSDYEWAVGNQDSLGFNTVYAASPSDPDVSLAVIGNQINDLNPSWSTRLIKSQSLGLSYYKNISTGSGTWVKSNVRHWSKIGNIWRWTYAHYLSLPRIDKPKDIFIDEVRPTEYPSPDYLDRYHDTRDYWAWGDSTLDNLGYNTVYVKIHGGESYLGMNSKAEITGYQRYICSNYSWTKSANGTNEYYLEQQDGTELAAAFDKPNTLLIGGPTAAPEGTVSSLEDGSWGYGQGAGDSRTVDTIYYRSDSGDPDTLGTMIQAVYDFTLYASKYKWTESGTSNEWYITLTDDTDPSIAEPTILTLNGYAYTKGTAGALAALEWDYGDEDSLGFDTLYVYATSSPDGSVGTGMSDETAPSVIYVRDDAADYSYFIVDKVDSDTEMSIVGSPTLTASGSEPTFYYNHNPFRSTYKLNIQGYSEGLIYCLPFTGPEVAPDDISGPFYAGLQQGDWKYEAKILEDEDASSTGNDYGIQPCLARNEYSHVQINPWFGGDRDGANAKSWISTAYAVSGNNDWTRRDTRDDGNTHTFLSVNDDADGSNPLWWTSIQAFGSTYVAAITDDFNPNPKPGVAYTTDLYGLVWIRRGDDAYEWAEEDYATSEYIGLAAAWNSGSPGRIVALYWRASDDRVVVRYTDDSGDNFSDTNISGDTFITDGDNETKIYYLGGQFIILVKDGLYYGDGTSFTKVAISGATQLKSLAYNNAGTYAAIESPTASVWTSNVITSGWEETTLPKSFSDEETNWIIWDNLAERWVVNTEWEFLWTDNLTVDPATGYPPWGVSQADAVGAYTGTQAPTNMVVGNEGILWGTHDAPIFTHIRLLRFSHFWWDVDLFVPISRNYRSTTFSVLQGYTLLIGLSEREFEKIPNPTTEIVTTDPAIDGEAKDFTFKLASLGEVGIQPESVLITATVADDNDETVEKVEDDGDGILKGSVSATGTISYDTGECRLVFNSKTVKNGTTISAKYNFLTEGRTLGWKYYPRRVRWSVPQTYNDFEEVGSGTADVNGEGAFLDARTVNGRVVVFESNSISTIVPRGDVTDPWDYEPIKASVRNLSNPVVIDDSCYFIASDGLLWKTDGINVSETGSAFDITAFDDFSEIYPVTLDYSSALNSLLVYYFNPSADTHKCYAISLSTGNVTSVGLPTISDSGSLSELPANVCSVSESSDQRILLSYHPLSSDTDQVVVASLDLDGGITGKDQLVVSGQDNYWYSTVESGEMFITPEGSKSSIHHVIVRTYSASNGSDNTNRPSLAIELKSLEDSAWHNNGDTVGTATMTDSELTGSGTAWSNTIALGDDATDTFTLPCQGAQARVYIDSTLQTAGTDYTISGNNITLSAVLAGGTTLYAYWDAYPEVKLQVGDAFKSSEGFHRVTSITTATSAVVDHYLSSGSESVTHYPLFKIPDGEGETKIGIRKLVEGVLVRLYVIPEYNADDTEEVGGETVPREFPSIVKITGIIIGHAPQGRKILSATGS